MNLQLIFHGKILTFGEISHIILYILNLLKCFLIAMSVEYGRCGKIRRLLWNENIYCSRMRGWEFFLWLHIKHFTSSQFLLLCKNTTEWDGRIRGEVKHLQKVKIENRTHTHSQKMNINLLVFLQHFILNCAVYVYLQMNQVPQ